MKKIPMRFRVNGRIVERMVAPNRLLVEVLREDLRLTGTKIGCDDGSCGACMVLLDGKPVPSCMVPAAACRDVPITTVEGLAGGREMDVVQRAFAVTGGSQCGYCTPGFVMTVRALLNDHPEPGPEEIRAAISGNFCRCTGYTKILEAIARAVEWERKRRTHAPAPAAARAGD